MERTEMNHALKVLGIVISVFFAGYFLEEIIDSALSHDDELKDMVEGDLELLTELASVFVSFSIFTMTWHAYGKSRDNHSLFLGATFFIVGLLSLFHLLSYPFMPDFITSNTEHKAAIFLIESRIILAILFFISVYFYKDTLPELINKRVLLAMAAVLSAVSIASGLFYHTHLFENYDPESGLSSSVLFLLSAVTGIIAGTSHLYAKRLRKTGQKNLIFLIYGLIIILFSNLVYFSYEFSGHFLIITGFFFMYLALYKSSVELPYEKLAVAEDKLRQAAEEKYKNLFDNTSDAIVLTDLEENITSWNRGAEKIFGWTAKEAAGKKLSQLLVPPNMLPMKVKIIQDVMSGKVVSGIDVICPHKSGSEINVSLTASPIRDMNQNIIGMSGILRDITERKRVQEALLESEERYRTIIEFSNDMIWTLDAKGNFLFFNKHAEELSGYKLETWFGKSFAPMIVKEDLPKVIEAFCKVLSGEPQQYEVSIKCGNGSILLLSVNSAPIYSKGVITGTVSFGRDITEHKKAEKIRRENERLMHASIAKSEFLTTMSHELRTPLNSIIGFSELLHQKTPGELNEKQDHYVGNILKSSKHLLELINDILDLSKVEAGKIELVIEKISLPEVMEESLDIVKENAIKQNIILKKDFDHELEFIEADRQRFKQILYNLLSNAVKFSKKKGGTVTITTKKEGDMAKISVSDTGIGIREEDMGKLFKEFEQLDSGISRRYGGTGLGLAITRKLVELHGGRIMVNSTFGEGTTFTFLLPRTARKGSAL